jgi:predicted metal-dependent peptidase
VNRQIGRDNLKIPPVKLQHIGSSYKNSDSWIAVSEDLIIAYIYLDVAAVLTKDELKATILHDICHVKIQHLEIRTLSQEIEADVCAYDYGIGANVLMSAIDKLVPNGAEKNERIRALKELIRI